LFSVVPFCWSKESK